MFGGDAAARSVTASSPDGPLPQARKDALHVDSGRLERLGPRRDDRRGRATA